MHAYRAVEGMRQARTCKHPVQEPAQYEASELPAGASCQVYCTLPLPTPWPHHNRAALVNTVSLTWLYIQKARLVMSAPSTRLDLHAGG